MKGRLRFQTHIIGMVVAGLLYTGCSAFKPTGENRTAAEKTSAGSAVKIASLEPNRGARGSTVIINGSGFSDNASQLVVQFGATRASIKNSGDKVIVAEVPPAILDGKYNVTVTQTQVGQTSGPVEFLVQGGAVSESASKALSSNPESSSGSGAGSTSSTASAQGAGAKELKAASWTVPAGTTLIVRSVDSVSSAKNQVGDRFELTLDEPLVVSGHTVAQKGSRVTGRVAQAKGSGRVKGLAQLGVTLVSLQPVGSKQVYEIRTNTHSRQAQATKKRDAAVIAGGAGIGTAIGAIAGGGKGAAIGAAAGGGAGTGAVLATKGKEVDFPPETRLTFKLRSPLTAN